MYCYKMLVFIESIRFQLGISQLSITRMLKSWTDDSVEMVVFPLKNPSEPWKTTHVLRSYISDMDLIVPSNQVVEPRQLKPSVKYQVSRIKCSNQKPENCQSDFILIPQ